MSIATLNPWQVLDQLQQDAFRRHTESASSNGRSRHWHPALDITESTEGYHLLIDLPGVAQDQVDIEVENNQLSITGQRNQATTTPIKRHHNERMQGTFSRQFKLPKDADTTEIHASFELGVLSVNIKKREESKPRKVSIEIKS